MCVSTVKQMEKIIALEGGDIKPIFGICMGNQLMGLAAGCTAQKLPFGNRGQNQVFKIFWFKSRFKLAPLRLLLKCCCLVFLVFVPVMVVEGGRCGALLVV